MTSTTARPDSTAGVRLEKRPDGVALLIFDTPASPVNVLSPGLIDEVGPLLDEIERDAGVRAVVLASGKQGTFIAGADLKRLLAVETAEQARAFSRSGQALLARIEASRKPFVAAIYGAVLGGGVEVVLACHYRLAADDPKTVFALPEAQLGVLPGGGGTQRLPRLIGLTQALPLLLTGKRVRAGKARRLGLVDALTSPGGIVGTASRAALALADGTLHPRRVKRSFVARLMEKAPFKQIVFRKARASVQAKTRGLYPAPAAIIDCVETGLARGRPAGLERETHFFGELVASPAAKNLIGLFEAMTALKKPPAGVAPREVRRLGVVGGGFMGRGIAAVSVPLVPVTVKDISEDVLQRCGRSVHDGLTRRVRSHAITAFQRDQQMARLRLTTNDDDLARSDLVIETVFEELALKREIVAAVEARVSAECVIASNTSALPIGEIAAGARRPERVLGMHYFSPVPKMQLLELVVTPRTSDRALATAHAFGLRQGKAILVVRDGPGFYTTRILSPYVNEAIVLLEEGVRIEQVDRALLDFGYPVGPLALLDEVGIDIGAHVGRTVGGLLGKRGLEQTDAYARLIAADVRGRKSGRGFYRYDERGGRMRKKQGRRPVNEEVYELLGGVPRHSIPRAEIADRVALMMINEAAHCLQEGVIASPRDGDLGAILGLGFPPF
ncbi:MAG: enoyl-CoA hydratase/isomerase family protein, partial [Acidobacteriota bacterium]